MALAALIVSIASALAAVAAVWVSVCTHRQQGSRVECTWSNAWPVYGSFGQGERHIQVQAINHGRSPTTIAGWGLEIVDANGKPTDSTVVIFNHEAVAAQAALPVGQRVLCRLDDVVQRVAGNHYSSV